ncbi:hypothetical protein [Pelagibacterium montanilacus]|uniref:hypothetical protein n=1 Tax=Pelagibacterium montanilacus TaxID=2185280 RepID=UPI000F8F7AB7|nr:hypothetical protein [Pelagibacterium montanilacus]
MGLVEYFERIFLPQAAKPEPMPFSRPSTVSRPEPAPQQTRFERDLGLHVARAKAKGGPVVAGSIEVVGLDDIRQTLGPRWDAVASRALAIAAEVIAERISEDDFSRDFGDGRFAICFGNCTKPEAEAQARVISNAIKARLIDSMPDETARISVSRFVAEVEPGALDAETGDLTDLLMAQMARMNVEAKQAAHAFRRNMLKEFKVLFAPMWSARDERTHINRCVLDLSLGCSTLAQFRAIADPDQMTATLSDIDRLVLTRVIEAFHANYKATMGATLLVPVSYNTLKDPEGSADYLQLLSAVPPLYLNALALEVTSLPATLPGARLASLLDMLGAFTTKVAVEINGRGDLLDSDVAPRLWGVGWNLYGLDHTDTARNATMSEAVAKARDLGIMTMAHGANSIGLALGAVEAGIEHVDGPAIHLWTHAPRPPTRLNPLSYPKRASNWG